MEQNRRTDDRIESAGPATICGIEQLAALAAIERATSAGSVIYFGLHLRSDGQILTPTFMAVRGKEKAGPFTSPAFSLFRGSNC